MRDGGRAGEGRRGMAGGRRGLLERKAPPIKPDPPNTHPSPCPVKVAPPITHTCEPVRTRIHTHTHACTHTHTSVRTRMHAHTHTHALTHHMHIFHLCMALHHLLVIPPHTLTLLSQVCPGSPLLSPPRIGPLAPPPHSQPPRLPHHHLVILLLLMEGRAQATLGVGRLEAQLGGGPRLLWEWED